MNSNSNSNNNNSNSNNNNNDNKSKRRGDLSQRCPECFPPGAPLGAFENLLPNSVLRCNP